MKPHKIVYLNHVSYIGGAEISLLDLLTYLNRDLYTPVAFVPEGELADRLQKLQVRCVPIPVLTGLNRYTLPRFLWVLPQLVALTRQEAPDLLHANTNFISEYTGLLSKFTTIPSIAHIQDMEPFGRMGQWVIRQNTRLVALSDAVKRFLREEHVPEHQIVRIYHGVDLRQYRPCETVSRQDSVTIGLIGQLGARKGHQYFLEAAWMLVQTHPNVRFWIVGKEPAHSTEHYTEQLEQYIHDYHLQPYVKFWGFRADIAEILGKIDILVLSSLQEPFGKIVIEAMARQKPVIASSVGGVPEIVVDGKTGLLVPPANAEALRQALELLILDRRKRERMGLEGRRRVEQHFSLENTVWAVEGLYEEMLQGRKLTGS